MSTPSEAPSPGRCAFPLPRKRRPCGMPTKTGSSLCGAHSSTLHCPSCNTTLASERALLKHLRICPAVRRVQKEREHPWCITGCNIASQSDSQKPNPNSLQDLTEPYAIIPTVEILLSRSVYPSPPAWVPCLPLQPILYLPEAASIEQAWSDTRNSQIKLEPKHFAQFGPLAGSLLHNSPVGPLTVLELGAGRAYTSLYVAHAMHLRNVSAKFVAVDRAGGRLKADRAIRAWVEDEGSSLKAFRRIKCDVADFCMREVEEIRDAGDVRVVGKHVCGAALDASLAAVNNFVRAERRSEGSVRMVFACCCRRLCRWEWLGDARKAWVDWDVDERFYEGVCRMAQWGLDQKHSAERAEMGRKCRLLIDTARVQWLRSQGWEAYVGEYTTASPESACIAAVWKGSGPRMQAEVGSTK